MKSSVSRLFQFAFSKYNLLIIITLAIIMQIGNIHIYIHTTWWHILRYELSFDPTIFYLKEYLTN